MLASRGRQLLESAAAIAARIDASGAESRKRNLMELTRLESERAVLEQEARKAQQQRQQLLITAPVTGTVQELAVHTLGAVVAPAQALLKIVPEQAAIEVEALLPNRDIGFVNEGQLAEVKIDTFNFTKYGLIDAELVNISNDAVEDQQLGWVFKLRLQLEQDSIAVEDKWVKLSPGMATTAEIKYGQAAIDRVLFVAPAQVPAGKREGAVMADSVDQSSPRDSGKRKSRRRWLWFGLLVPVFFVIAWLEPDEEDLFELCSTQGKPTIYRSVVAEGYYDGAADDCWGCWGYLRNTDYKFIEFSLSRKRRHFDPITEPGIYRVSRIQAGSPQCHEKLTAYYTKAQMMRDEFERNNWCFQVERFDTRQARYGYYREGPWEGLRSSPITGSSIAAKRFYFVDHDTEESSR